jgi:hypothetical protein
MDRCLKAEIRVLGPQGVPVARVWGYGRNRARIAQQTYIIAQREASKRLDSYTLVEVPPQAFEPEGHICSGEVFWDFVDIKER